MLFIQGGDEQDCGVYYGDDLCVTFDWPCMGILIINNIIQYLQCHFIMQRDIYWKIEGSVILFDLGM